MDRQAAYERHVKNVAVLQPDLTMLQAAVKATGNKQNTSTSIFVTNFVTTLGQAFTGEQFDRIRIHPPRVVDKNQQILCFPADAPFELNGIIDRVQFEDIVARLNFFNLRSYVEGNLQHPIVPMPCYAVLPCYQCYLQCCGGLRKYYAYVEHLEIKMIAVQNQIKADMKIVANSIDAELNARDANLHFRVAPDFTWIEFYCQNGWSAPGNNAIVMAPGYQDVPPRMEQAPEYIVGNQAPEYSSNQAPEYRSNQAPEYSIGKN